MYNCRLIWYIYDQINICTFKYIVLGGLIISEEG